MDKHNIDDLIEHTTPRKASMAAYDGASGRTRELALWNPGLQSADKEIILEKGILDSRVRDSARNDSYVRGGVTLHRDSIVGSQFVLNCKPNWEVLGLTEEWAVQFQKEVEAKFTLAAESPNNYFDAKRMNTFTGLIRLAVGVFTLGGEVLATAEWIKDKNRPFGTAIQMVDADRLSNPRGYPDTANMRGGIETGFYGEPQFYNIRNAHPSDLNLQEAWTWNRIPAAKPWGRKMVLHIIEQMRPDQTRGISDMVSALKEMRMTKKFRDITLQNAVLNATFAAVIESELPPEAAFGALGASGSNEYVQEYLQNIGAYSAGAKNLQIDGVKIPHLYPGTKLNLQPVGTPGGVGSNFEQSMLRYLAASLNVSYEQLSRDYTQTNYSSARAAMAETWKFMQSRKKFVADNFATMIYRLWLEEMISTGQIALPPNAPSWYEGLNADAYAACDWIGASRGQIDELKETNASVIKLQNNLSTLEEELGKDGKDWRKVLAQRAREKKLLEELGLSVDPNEQQQGQDNQDNTGNTDKQDNKDV